MYGARGKTSVFFDLLSMIILVILCGLGSMASAQEEKRSTIIILGDSLTQGYGLLPIDNFVSKLDEFVTKDNYPFRLLNLGVSGDTTAGGLERFDWSLTPDVRGAVVILGGNDLLRGISPEHSYNNLKAMIILAEAKEIPVLLVGMTASNNYGMEYKTAFDNVFHRLNEEFDLFYYENFFSALDPTDVKQFLSFMQSDGIHPNKEGVKRIVINFYPTFASFLDHIDADN